MKIIASIVCSLMILIEVSAQNDSASTAKSFKKISVDLKQYSKENFKRSGIRLYTDPEEGLFSIFKLIPEWVIEFFSKPEDLSKEKIGEPFLIIAHRGSPGKEIENTIPSFKRALDDGANALEMDVCITKDKKAVIWHDWDPDELKALLRENGVEPDVIYKPHPPENDLRKKIPELTYEEWKNNFSFKKSGTDSVVKPQLASLEDIFKWGSKEERIKYIFFDVKAPEDEAALGGEIVKQINTLRKKYNSKFQIVVETTFEDVLQEMKKTAPELDYSYDVEPYAGLVLAPQMFSAVQYAINYENRSAIPLKAREVTIANGTTLRRIIKYDLELMREYNKAYPNISIKTFACATINDPEEQETLIKMGIDGIQTDKPELLKQAADKYKRKTNFKGYDITTAK